MSTEWVYEVEEYDKKASHDKQMPIHTNNVHFGVLPESAWNAGNLVSVPGLGRPPGEGKGYPLLYSGLENSMDCIVHGVAKNQTWLSDSHFQGAGTDDLEYVESNDSELSFQAGWENRDNDEYRRFGGLLQQSSG